NIKRIDVQTADQMYETCHTYFPNTDIAIMAAAVADYKPAQTHQQKIKKSEGNSQIELAANKDILKSLGKIKTDKQLLIGFALETNDAIAHAQQKLEAKRCDAIVLNTLEDKGAGFGHDTNKVYILSTKAEIQSYALQSKQNTAKDICNFIATYLVKDKD
ncbi:MAG: phosphopantothenoylcysteine decarboxylase, partial [Bacteroidia bacterium]